jgi:hypothetical protein
MKEEWIALQQYIPEISDSNLDPDTGYPDWGLLCFFSVTSSKQYLKFGH